MRSRFPGLVAFSCLAIFTAAAQTSPILTGCSGPSMGSLGSYSVTAYGSGFAPGATLLWNGAAVTTALASSTQLNGSVPAAMVTAADSYLLTESSDGVRSNCVLIALQPPPAISSATPTQVNAGGSTFVLTLFGTGFVAGSQASWAGYPAATAFIGPGQLNVSVAATAITSSGRYLVTVSNPDGSVSNSVAFYVQPVLGSISPTLVVAGTPSVTITATGTGFVPNDILVLSRLGVRQALATTYLGPTSLSAIIPASALQAASQDKVFVSDVDQSSGIASNSLNFRIGNGPMISSVNGNMRAAGSPDYAISVAGDGFAAGSVVQWNGTPLPTAFVSTNELAATVPARMLAAPATAAITVVNPAGSVSNAMGFTVTPPGLVISGLTPASAAAGGPAFTLVVGGSGFGAGAAAAWNGQVLPTTVSGDAQLTAAIPAALIAASGTAAITVVTSAGVSNTLPFRIAPPTPVVSTDGIVNAFGSLPSIAPGSLLSIWGTNLASAAATPDSPALVQNTIGSTSVTVNGLAAPLLYVSPTLINAQLPFEVTAGTTRLVVEVDGVKSAPSSFCVTATAPGVAIDATSHAVAVNYSDGSVNSSDHPASPGQYVILYLTGQGALDNPLSTGYPAPPTPFLHPLAQVQAMIGGVSAQVSFAGLVPGWIGILQVNLQIPNAPAGEQPLELSIGPISANPTTLSIKNP